MSVIDQIKTIIPTLNQSQIEAITSTDGPVIIIAGPGTGKTLTIVARTLYILLSNKAQPEEIILTTFTEKAAYELRDRLSQLAKKFIYKNNIQLIRIGTIHSLCNEFIEKYIKYTPLEKGYTVLDELTQQFFIYDKFDQIVQVNKKLYFGRWSSKWETIKNLISYFNKITEEMIDPANLSSNSDSFLKMISKSYLKYQKLLFSNNKVDFAHIQKIFYDLLNDKQIYKQIKKKIKYIMVDEYQDTNYIQEQIFLKLAYPTNNICVVGDEDQSLYRFRGATVRNILQFPKNFKECKQIKLVINYRSHKTIIEKYNKFISSISWEQFRYPKEIKPNPQDNFSDYPSVFCIWEKGKKREAERFILLLKFLKEKGIIHDWSDIVLLLKSVRQEHSGHYIEALKKNNIPYFAPRAKKFFENEEIKLLIACYVLIFGFYDNLVDYSHKNYIKECIIELGRIKDKFISIKNYLRRKKQQFENLTESSLDLTVLDYFYQLLAYEPFSSFLKDENKTYNLSIFSQLISIFQEYYGYSLVTAKNKEKIKFYFFNSFLNFLIESGIDEYEDPDNPIPKGFVQIMTIHQSKGLEFPVVIVGSLHKKFAVQKQVDRDLLEFSKRGQFEPEERITEFDRLRHYYVAFSRAQNLLVLTTPENPQSWFSPIWEGLDQYPFIDEKALQNQRFTSKSQFIPKKSYSFSQINVYEVCPQQYLFYYKYQFQPSRSAQILFGSLVHYTIEDIHRAILDGIKFDISDIEIWFDKNYKSLTLSGLRPISKTQREVALKHVLNYYTQNKDILNKIKETEVDVSVEKDDYIISGKIDLLFGSNGKLEILDFKTQPKPSPDDPSIIKYRNQLCLYAYIIRERYSKQVEKMYIYWTAEEKRKDALMELKYSEDEVEEAGRYFDELVHKILKKDFKVVKQPNTEKVCKECDFRFYCSENGIIKFKTKELMEI